MSSRDDLLAELAEEYTVVPDGVDAFLITHDHGDALGQPIRLALPEALFDEYVVSLLRSSKEPDVASAVGLVRVHLDAAVQSSLVVGQPVVALGVRRDGLARRVRWFVDRGVEEDHQAQSRAEVGEWRP